MKKILALVLASIMVFALVACGGSGSSNTASWEEITSAADSAAPAESTPAPAAPSGEKVKITLATGGTSGTY